MTDLNEQLAREELKEYTDYYVRKKDGSTDIQMWINKKHSSAVEWWNQYGVKEVLAPVPSYEEWKAKNEENERLKKQLDIAVKILTTKPIVLIENVQIALKDMREVK